MRTTPTAIRRTLTLAAATIAAVTLTAAAPADAAVHRTFMVENATYVQVTVAPAHGALVHFKVAYAWDNYIHEDVIPAAANVSEIDNYTGQNPDTGARFNGCAATRHPDRLTTWDDDSAGVTGQPHTSLHHNADLTFRPYGSGPFFSWCHYEHGPETTVTLTFADGSTVTIVWCMPTRFREITLVPGPVTTAAAVAGDGD